jgi:hypothetical protein
MVTASFGVAEALTVLGRTGDKRPSALIVAADEALYTAKREGRDRVQRAQTITPKRDSILRLCPPLTGPPPARRAS